jgi:hypothetical protein
VIINQILSWSGCLLAVCLYLPLVSGIWKDKIQQSFATWILWVSLDIIALVSIFLQGGNYLVLVFYVTIGSIVSGLLLYKKQFKWTKFETLVLFLVLVCLVFWWFSGSRTATILSSIAVVIAGMPQLKESLRGPDKVTGYIYLGFTAVNALFFFAGKSWTVEDRFYPALMVPLCTTIAVAALRKGSSVKIIK